MTNQTYEPERSLLKLTKHWWETVREGSVRSYVTRRSSVSYDRRSVGEGTYAAH